MKHTPGPWRAEQVRMGGPRNSYLAWSVQGKGGCVAETRYTGIHPKNQIGEDEANARLIAAAPDGLNAAQLAYLALLKHDHDAWRVKNQGVYCALRDFIAKATGQTSGAVQDAYELAALNEACAAIERAKGES